MGSRGGDVRSGGGKRVRSKGEGDEVIWDQEEVCEEAWYQVWKEKVWDHVWTEEKVWSHAWKEEKVYDHVWQE